MLSEVHVITILSHIVAALKSCQDTANSMLCTCFGVEILDSCGVASSLCKIIDNVHHKEHCYLLIFLVNGIPSSRRHEKSGDMLLTAGI